MTDPGDRFGSPIDALVGYARGPILRSTDEEVAKTLRARRLVRERIASHGRDSVFDLSGMNRGAGLAAGDLDFLGSHVPFFAAFEGETEPLALRHMGADPARHDALILNRVSAANFLALTTVLRPGDRVLALAPAGGTTHPSVRRPVGMAAASLEEFHDLASLGEAWRAGPPAAMLVVTPISASKHHLEADTFRRALELAGGERTVVYVDDAHLASRIGFWGEPPTFEMGPVDLAVCSTDKHVAGPRAGVLVGRRDLVTTIRSRAFELGLEAQASQYVGVRNALRDFDPKPIAEAGEVAKDVLRMLVARYGERRVYLGGPGVSISGEDAIEIARERRGAAVAPRLVPVEASSLVALAMLEADGLLTIAAVAMPGSAPVVRLMMYPDGPRLGPDRIVASLAGAFERLAGVIDDIPAARRLLLG
jgi:L-seryl-tRNA(Ser) seleniumtransferase